MLQLPDLNDFFFKFRYPILIFLVGALLTGLGLFVSKNDIRPGKDNVEVLTDTTEGQENGLEIVVEIAGEVINPGVYSLPKNSRIEDLLVAAGGVSPNADRDWMGKSLNRAARLADGTKIYIPSVGERSIRPSANWGSGGSSLININLASQKELESLPGIGPVYAQNIIEHRPYSNVEELSTKGALRKSTYEKIKNLVTAY
ncbi:helix-hairpin-helix domain-containing protein [Candidatus Woesebacteria bacterium]|nr:helix-hairpin-helix domain-containing protein [Candidatus Woesebacteria bacterium]